MEINATTPKRITKSIRKFIEVLGLNYKTARFLPFTEVSHDYQDGHCLSNCEAEHKRTGDKIIYGWVIWEDKYLSYISGEFHAVIKRDGALTDITPRKDGESKILYVPDKSRTPLRRNDRSWKSWQTCESIRGEFVQKPEEVIFEATVPNLITVD